MTGKDGEIPMANESLGFALRVTVTLVLIGLLLRFPNATGPADHHPWAWFAFGIAYGWVVFGMQGRGD